jgi:hypothetical protein
MLGVTVWNPSGIRFTVAGIGEFSFEIGGAGSGDRHILGKSQARRVINAGKSLWKKAR